MLKNKLLQFNDFYNMTCVYWREEDKLSVCNKTTPSCIPKKKLKFCFCIWTRMTWPLTSKSTFPSKISLHNSWKTAQLCKMLCNNVTLTIQRFEYNALYQSFLVQCLLSTYWKLLVFLESIWSFFNSKALSRVPLIIFVAIMVSPTTYWGAWPW